MITMTNSLKSTAAAMSLLFVPIPCTAAEFFLKDGDRVVMMGDSITEQHLYSSYVEAWTLTRFPAWDLKFFNVGITAHTTQFAEPGWRYMDKACAKIDPATWGGNYVALRDPKTGDWSLIVCADKPVTLQVQVAGKLAKGDVHVWKSNEKIQFIEEKPLRLTNGAFTVSLEGNSVYTLSTTTGQKKGAHPHEQQVR